jgi:hypothetical protein
MPNDHRGRSVHGGKVTDDEYVQLHALMNHANFDSIKAKGWVSDSDVERYGQATDERVAASADRPQRRVVHPTPTHATGGRKRLSPNWQIDNPFDGDSPDREGDLYGDLSY